jgi:hypothetical protein
MPSQLPTLSQGPSGYINAAANSMENNETDKGKPTKFPTLIAISGGCSFVAIVALLSTYFVSKRKKNALKNKWTGRKAGDDYEQDEVLNCSLADDDSSIAISYGNGSLLSDLEMRSMNIDINACPDDVSYLNTSSVVGLGIRQDKGQGTSKLQAQKHRQHYGQDMEHPSIESNTKSYPQHEVRKQALSPGARKFDFGTSFAVGPERSEKYELRGPYCESVKASDVAASKINDVNESRGSNLDERPTNIDFKICPPDVSPLNASLKIESGISQGKDNSYTGDNSNNDTKRTITMQVLSPLARKYDVDTSFDEGTEKPSDQNKFEQTNMTTYQESVAASAGASTDYHGEHRKDSNRNNLRPYADSITTFSMADSVRVDRVASSNQVSCYSLGLSFLNAIILSFETSSTKTPYSSL